MAESNAGLIPYLSDCRFHDEYDPTIEDSYCRHIEVDGQEYTLDITDTAGQVEYRKHWNDSFQSCGDGFVCVYSIASHDSFRELAGYRDQIWNSKQSRHVPMMMVGNKFDLEAKGERQVATDAGARFAEQSNSLFLEASAKTGRNIDEMFIELVREIERTRKLREDSGLFNKDDAYIPEKSVPVPACIQGYSTNATPPMVRMLDIGGEDVKKGHCGCAIM
ncbi:Ras GTPase [Mortierella sp. GBA30]|nr:Ras GTPase [Mortierella sp. GBA30]